MEPIITWDIIQIKIFHVFILIFYFLDTAHLKEGNWHREYQASSQGFLIEFCEIPLDTRFDS